MITPAISVLSAVEGLAVITPLLERYVIPVTIFIAGFFHFKEKLPRRPLRVSNSAYRFLIRF